MAVAGKKAKSPTTAGWLSFVFGGFGGFFYAGHPIMGTVVILVQCLNVVLFFFMIGFFTLPLVWIMGTVYSYVMTRADIVQNALIAGTQQRHSERL